MKEVNLNKDDFWYDDKVVSDLKMGNGKHIRFTAVDNDYKLDVEHPDKSKTSFHVPKDNNYHKFEIKGSKNQTYTFTIAQDKPPVTVPQMIVTVD